MLNALRKWLFDTRVVVALLLAVTCGIASAADVAVVVDDSKPGTYLVTVGADGAVVVNPIRVIRPGQPPDPGPTPPPGDPTPPPATPLAAIAQSATATALSQGGSQNTAAVLSVVYSAVGVEVSSGAVLPEHAASRLKAMTDGALKLSSDPPGVWAKWRTTVGDALTPRVGTKDQWATALKDVSAGTRAAVDAMSAKIGQAFNWQFIIEFILPLLLELLKNWKP